MSLKPVLDLLGKRVDDIKAAAHRGDEIEDAVQSMGKALRK